MQPTCLMRIAVLLFFFAHVGSVPSTCLIDLDDKSYDKKIDKELGFNTSYTKKFAGVTYHCASMCDHCCTDEGYCCDPTARPGSTGTGASKCLEDESGNVHMANCGFRMLCCEDSNSLPGQCAADTSDGTGRAPSPTPTISSAQQMGIHCIVDLDDQNANDIGHTSHERKYTKVARGITYTCASLCDHCCVEETSCCDPGSLSEEKDIGVGAFKCLEDESGNVHMSDCGFKMLCCTDPALLPSGECPDSALLIAVLGLAVFFCVIAIGTAIGVYCCWRQKCCCWQKFPPTTGCPQTYAQQNLGPVTVVGQPVMPVAVVTAPVKGEVAQ